MFKKNSKKNKIGENLFRYPVSVPYTPRPSLKATRLFITVVVYVFVVVVVVFASVKYGHICIFLVLCTSKSSSNYRRCLKSRKPRPLQIASIRCVIHFSYPVSCPKAFEGWPLYNLCLRFVSGFRLKPLI